MRRRERTAGEQWRGFLMTSAVAAAVGLIVWWFAGLWTDDQRVRGGVGGAVGAWFGSQVDRLV